MVEEMTPSIDGSNRILLSRVINFIELPAANFGPSHA